MALTAQEIAKALQASPENVAASLPLLDTALAVELNGEPSSLVRLAALATVRVECPSFLPVREIGSNDYFREHYWDNERVRRMLGNRTAHDAVTYCGRGFIQLTGYDNYFRYGTLLELDLVRQPDLALEPHHAARIFAAYFRKCVPAAERMDWTRVRELVNGGHNGLLPFLLYLRFLTIAAGMLVAADKVSEHYIAAKASAKAGKENV